MTANMVTADGTVVAVEVESDGAIAGVMGAFPDPGYGGAGAVGGDVYDEPSDPGDIRERRQGL